MAFIAYKCRSFNKDWRIKFNIFHFFGQKWREILLSVCPIEGQWLLPLAQSDQTWQKPCFSQTPLILFLHTRQSKGQDDNDDEIRNSLDGHLQDGRTLSIAKIRVVKVVPPFTWINSGPSGSKLAKQGVQNSRAIFPALCAKCKQSDSRKKGVYCEIRKVVASKFKGTILHVFKAKFMIFLSVSVSQVW